MKYGGEIAGGVFVMSLIYFASPILVIKYVGMTPPPRVEKALSVVYYPAEKAANYCSPYREFLKWQIKVLLPDLSP